MNGQAEAKSDENSVATLNMHDSWLRTFQECEPPKSSRSPRKSTKSWDPWSVQRLTKAAQSRKRVHRMGKVGPTEPRGVEGTYQNSRCASREKTWVQSTKKLNENWDAISLVFLSAVLREFYQLPEHVAQFKPYYAFKRIELATPTSTLPLLHLGTTVVLLLESLRSPRIEHLMSVTTSHEKWKKIRYYAENFVLLVVQGFIDSFFMLYFTYVSDIVIAGLWKFIMCPATIQSDNNSEQA